MNCRYRQMANNCHCRVRSASSLAYESLDRAPKKQDVRDGFSRAKVERNVSSGHG